MALKSLLLCSDEKIVRVLRRVLGDLDIEIELCADADSVLYRLTRRRFEGIVVDCEAPGASQVLKSARSAPCNKQAVAVAIVQPAVGLREVFGLGAHFVLYKPVSSERAKSSARGKRTAASLAFVVPTAMSAQTRSSVPGFARLSALSVHWAATGVIQMRPPVAP